MSMLVARARLDLSDPDWQFLALGEKQRSHYQSILDDSQLEGRLRDAFSQTLEILTSTDLKPTDVIDERDDIVASAPVRRVIIVSKHAALLARLLLPESYLRHTSSYAVGRSAALFFQSSDIQINNPLDAGFGESASALLSLPQFKELEDESVLLIKGEQGLDYLEKECRARGADVRVWNVYQRQASASVASQWQRVNKDALESLYAVSVYALEHLLQGMPNQEEKTFLLNLGLFAMSERIALAAENMGFTRVKVHAV